MRGTLTEQWEPRIAERIIPACAGNSRTSGRSGRARSDHPRVCGELSCRLGGQRRGVGSSPRVRGTRHRGLVRSRFGRIIPACAGNSPSRSRPARPATDHPRVCGELTISTGMLGPHDGSSPRVRGTHCRRHAARLFRRIIPACAGNSSFPSPMRTASTDHPRVCGELPLPAAASRA